MTIYWNEERLPIAPGLVACCTLAFLLMGLIVDDNGGLSGLGDGISRLIRSTNAMAAVAVAVSVC